MPKFCEYCGSENHLHVLRCHSCYAPFSAKAKRVVNEQGNVTWEYNPIIDYVSAVLPMMVLAALSTSIWQKVKGAVSGIRVRRGNA